MIIALPFILSNQSLPESLETGKILYWYRSKYIKKQVRYHIKESMINTYDRHKKSPGKKANNENCIPWFFLSLNKRKYIRKLISPRVIITMLRNSWGKKYDNSKTDDISTDFQAGRGDMKIWAYSTISFLVVLFSCIEKYQGNCFVI